MLIDFWTYSCINCLRTLPYIRAWDARYRKAGLTIVGVHSPEFAFERVESNVRENVRKLKLHYPVAMDNDYGTWQAWSNQYWPAKYLIDRSGHVRYYHFGEGEYGKTEEAIRTLLGADAPAPSGLEDRSPHGQLTPETYLGYKRLDRNGGDRSSRTSRTLTPSPEPARRTSWPSAASGPSRGSAPRRPRPASAAVPRPQRLPRVDRERIRASARRRQARADREGRRRPALHARRSEKISDHLLELRFSPGVAGLRVHVRVAEELVDLVERRRHGTGAGALERRDRAREGQRLLERRRRPGAPQPPT